MTTAIQENHREELPDPHEYAAHLERVLKPAGPKQTPLASFLVCLLVGAVVGTVLAFYF